MIRPRARDDPASPWDPGPVDDPLPDLLDEGAPPWPLPARVAAGVVGSLLLAVGLAGVVLPLLPGVPFLILAALLLGRSSPDLRRRVNALERRLPLGLRRCLRPRRAAPAADASDDAGPGRPGATP